MQEEEVSEGKLVKDLPRFWALNANKAPYLPAQQGPGCCTVLAGPGEGLCGRAWLPSGKASAGILKTLQSTKQLGNVTGIIKTLSSQVKKKKISFTTASGQRECKAQQRLSL